MHESKIKCNGIKGKYVTLIFRLRYFEHVFQIYVPKAEVIIVSFKTYRAIIKTVMLKQAERKYGAPGTSVSLVAR